VAVAALIPLLMTLAFFYWLGALFAK
jgi:hypothetical protein